MAKKAVSKKKKEEYLFAKESVKLSEERTLLSLIRTSLAIIGVGVAVLKLFTGASWSYLLAGVLIVLGLIILAEEIIKLQKQRKSVKNVKKEQKALEK